MLKRYRYGTKTYKDVPLKNVLNDVAKQSKLRLAYSGSFTDLSVKVSVQASGKDVKEVLAELSQKTNVNFEVRNGSIYIYIKEPPQKEKKEKASFSLSGTVYDENNLPLIGVNVLIKGTTKGTSSNMDGEFTITAEKGDILVLSYLGYTSKELTVKNKEPMRIVMSEDTKVLSEVVVIGYGAVRKTDVTGAISSIKMDDLSITTPTLEQALVGHAAGVEIKQTSGSPGEGLSLRVRGVSSTALRSRRISDIQRCIYQSERCSFHRSAKGRSICSYIWFTCCRRCCFNNHQTGYKQRTCKSRV